MSEESEQWSSVGEGEVSTAEALVFIDLWCLYLPNQTNWCSRPKVPLVVVPFSTNQVLVSPQNYGNHNSHVL